MTVYVLLFAVGIVGSAVLRIAITEWRDRQDRRRTVHEWDAFVIGLDRRYPNADEIQQRINEFTNAWNRQHGPS